MNEPQHAYDELAALRTSCRRYRAIALCCAGAFALLLIPTLLLAAMPGLGELQDAAWRARWFIVVSLVAALAVGLVSAREWTALRQEIHEHDQAE